MNEFYSICKENTEPRDEFQLKNLGKRTVIMIVGKYSHRNYGAETESPQSQIFYRDTNSNDYDGALAYKFTHCPLIRICIPILLNPDFNP
jgi:hypothetical protein